MIETFVENAARYLQDSALLAYLAVYVGGVLVSFTPCTYPVAPLTVAFIGARSSGSRSKGFFLSLVYVFGMSLTYTAIGAVAALTGKLFGQVQSNPWVFFIMANICILMGLSMLDAFTLPIRTPRFVTRLQPREKTRGAVGAFLVGAASGLVMGPCTAPVLAVLLSFAATRQSIPYAMSLLFVFSFGMGTLLIILGTSAGVLANLPRSGMWMTRVSKFFGWLMIAAGEYFLIQAGMLWG
ncbi:MAG TPA: cytochrome c biogenesis protein CcdA [Syntrophales bacterium]|jgi:thiol:disulfide interchange protein DsbD|nr:cytochrome c biogenesis protein CcdA [Syntrophales bacterium]HON22718.1 cytochrome c biogenesis protein CcdA [Syntrophales bacterium]HOU77755.1 cytochrome c biogenesis protein CcdA [Syntrophales bacterium]HPC32854.1 cytochrome c biogenesis protein CcdA [Syntrophales bacterium]HQG34886.1 cytochrome c biogenesis protein CcdA [Syntrophales bacterium]